MRTSRERAGRPALVPTLGAALLTAVLLVAAPVGDDAAGAAHAAGAGPVDASPAATATTEPDGSGSTTEPDEAPTDGAGSEQAGTDDAGSGGSAPAEAGSGGLLDGSVASDGASKPPFEVVSAAELPLGLQPWLVRVATVTTLALAGIGVVLAATSGPRRPRRRRG